mmetsp:Transcript_2384/g.3648  ORF Transcript_2384/g.3648 Transcript_2384/m.3648 type:complete len:184 (-) Transcript_2384:3636-4187(-)
MEIKSEIDNSAQANKRLMDPWLAENIDEVIEENLEKVLMYSDVHQHVMEGAQRKREIEEVKNQAQALMRQLKEKTEQQVKGMVANSLMFRRHTAIKTMMGNRTDALVIKFAKKLKTKVKESKENTILQENMRMIKEILKKQAFNNEFKKANQFNQGGRALKLQDKEQQRISIAMGAEIKKLMS